MRLVMRTVGCGALLAATLVATSHAEDYPRRVCASAQAYSGPSLRTIVSDDALTPKAVEKRPLDPETSSRLDLAFERARIATGASSMSAAVVIPGRGAWRSVYPASQAAPMQYWASVGKAFTAVAILQMVEEGKLSLSDPVSNWIEGVPNGDVVTVRHLLNHTSGLFSVNEDLVVRREGRRLSLEETLVVARRHGAMFCPGENWRYTNTGYTLLGAILEQLEGRTYAEIITDRIIHRLSRARLRVVTPDDALKDVAAPTPSNGEPPIDPRDPGAAGGIVGDAEGMIAFWRALLSGELLSTATLRTQFAELYPMFGGPESYGLGVMAYELPNPAGTEPFIWLGHSGGAPGVRAVVAYSLENNAFVAVAISGDGSAEASANLLLQQVQTPDR